jgi:hypothetical protein
MAASVLVKSLIAKSVAAKYLAGRQVRSLPGCDHLPQLQHHGTRTNRQRLRSILFRQQHRSPAGDDRGNLPQYLIRQPR